jgi:EmrB/QacA subfamily drug resistance transporter
MHLSRRGLVTLGILVGTFLAAIESTIVATAMPTVVAHFGGLAHYSWVFAGYMLSSTVTMPIWGKLSDLYGRRPFYLASVGLFLLGSALSGASQSMTQLILFRAIQGIGAGGLLPLGMTLLGEMYTTAERGRMQGLFSAVWGLSSIVGPLVGGYVTEAISWRWVFYLNLPFGLAAGAIVGSALVEPERHAAPRIDYTGAALLMVSVGTLMLALGQSGLKDAAMPAGRLGLLFGLALVAGSALLAWERRVAEPIVPLGLFRDRLVRTTTMSGFLTGVAMFGAISYVPLFVQAALGGTATQAGRTLTPLLLGWVSMSVVTGRLLPRTGHRPLVLTGLSLVTLGFFGLASAGHDTARVVLYLTLGVMGMGMGLTMLSLLLALQAAVPRTSLGAATSFAQFSRSIGGAVGVSLLGAVVAGTLPPGGEGQPLAMEAALQRAFATAAAIAVVALLTAFRIPHAGAFRHGEPTPPAHLDHDSRG